MQKMTGVHQLNILHFNDVYNVEECDKEACAGAARFTTALKHHRKDTAEANLTLFSGDALSPSMISSVTNGTHMVPILNEFGIDCAVIGNHDFDFGVDNMMECIEKSNYPWLNSNCYEHSTKSLLCNLPPFKVFERAGLRIGVIGLVEPDWIETLPVIDEDDVYVKDFAIQGSRLAFQLKKEFDCNIVIALTHMRWPNDKILAKKVPEIDLILGGHDHNSDVLRVKSANGQERVVIKSGTDFRQFKHIRLNYDVKLRKVTSVEDEDVFITRKGFQPDPIVEKLVRDCSEQLNAKMSRVIGQTSVEMDGRFMKIRTEETNLGNFLCDVALTSVEADCALINSGSIRIDRIIPVGDLTLKTLNMILPILDPVVVLELTGEELYQVLENSVSKVPGLEGRFAQVSRLNFTYDIRKDPGKRIDKESIHVNKTPICFHTVYRVAMNLFMSTGKDGYDILVGKRHIIDEENAIPLSTAVLNYFRTIQNNEKNWNLTSVEGRWGDLQAIQA